ncbi:hypothetical protein D9619_003769 [Psilocybe cf. subviscida]|uniref:Uncharacterized protein n=1 Tax=Psilocybe cf. subviscida TaxID=2480587 RepID=A0A8H5ETQ4_9AGAR|nr:hypothetical protein D9619_003769 [Psilocybe cf. subviscida]
MILHLLACSKEIESISEEEKSKKERKKEKLKERRNHRQEHQPSITPTPTSTLSTPTTSTSLPIQSNTNNTTNTNTNISSPSTGKTHETQTNNSRISHITSTMSSATTPKSQHPNAQNIPSIRLISATPSSSGHSMHSTPGTSPADFSRALEEAWAALPPPPPVPTIAPAPGKQSVLAKKASRQVLAPKSTNINSATSTQPQTEDPSPKRRLVPKKSKLGLLNLGGLGSSLNLTLTSSSSSSTPTVNGNKDFSDVMRRVGASTLTASKGGKGSLGTGAFEIYVDPSVDEGRGEVVMVKRKKSKVRVGLDGMRWGEGNGDGAEQVDVVTTIPRVPAVPAQALEKTASRDKAENNALLKVKTEESGSGRWWSIGRGRKDSKEEKRSTKENAGSCADRELVAIEYIHKPDARSKSPEPKQKSDTRGRFNSLDSALLLGRSKASRAPSPSPAPEASNTASEPKMTEHKMQTIRSASVDVASYLASGTVSSTSDKTKTTIGPASANVYNTSAFLGSSDALPMRSETPMSMSMRSTTPMSLYARTGTPTPNLNQPMARSPTPTKMQHEGERRQTQTYSRSATPTFGGLLAPPNANAGNGGGGSIALRAMKSVRSMARMKSWAQLAGSGSDAAAGGAEEKDGKEKEKKEKKEKKKSKKENAVTDGEDTGATGEKKKKSKSIKALKPSKSTASKKDKKAAKDELRPVSSSSFEVGALSSSPGPIPATLIGQRIVSVQSTLSSGSPSPSPMHLSPPQAGNSASATLGPSKKRSILGLGLPSTMRLPSVRSGSTASSASIASILSTSAISGPMPLAPKAGDSNGNRLSVDSHVSYGGQRPPSALSSTGSSLRPSSTVSRTSSAVSRLSGMSGTSGVSGNSGSIRWDEEGLNTVREQRRRERAAREGEEETEEGVLKKARRTSRESKHCVEGRRRKTIGDVFPEVASRPVSVASSQSPPAAAAPLSEVDEDGDVVMRSPASSVMTSSTTGTMERRRRAHSYPILTIEEATNDGHCALRDDDDEEDEAEALREEFDRMRAGNGGADEDGEEEEVQRTPVKKSRRRPMSEQLLGKSRPKPMHEDEEGVLSILDAATNDLALLINNLDLQATPSTPGDLSPFRPSAPSTVEKDTSGASTVKGDNSLSSSTSSVGDGSPARTIGRSRGRFVIAESPLKKTSTLAASRANSTNSACTLTSTASITSLRPYAQSRGYAPKASVNPAVAAASATVAAATLEKKSSMINVGASVNANAIASNNAAAATLIAQPIVPWNALLANLSPVKKASASPTSAAVPKRTSSLGEDAPFIKPATSSAFRPGHKRTYTPGPEPEPALVFQPLNPPVRHRKAPFARTSAPSPIVTIPTVAEEEKRDGDMDISELGPSQIERGPLSAGTFGRNAGRTIERGPISAGTFGGSISSMRSLTPVFKRISEEERKTAPSPGSALLPPPDFLHSIGSARSRGSNGTPLSGRSRRSRGSMGSTFSTANLSYNHNGHESDAEEDNAIMRLAHQDMQGVGAKLAARQTTRRVLGMSATFGADSANTSIDAADGTESDDDPDSDVPDELRHILQLTTGRTHSDASRPGSPVDSLFEDEQSEAAALHQIGSAAMLGEVTMTGPVDMEALARAEAANAPPLPVKALLPLAAPALPVFRASVIDAAANRYSITDTASAYESSPGRSSADDDTKKSFDFTGELRLLNESGGSDRRSFVEQLENAFRTPAKVDLKYDFDVAMAPPLPAMPVLPPPVPSTTKPLEVVKRDAVAVRVEFREAIEADESNSSMGGSVSSLESSSGFGGFNSRSRSRSRLVDVKQPSQMSAGGTVDASKSLSNSALAKELGKSSSSSSRLLDMFDADAPSAESKIMHAREPSMLLQQDETPEDSLFADDLSSPGIGRNGARGAAAEPSPARSERPADGELDRSFRFGGRPSSAYVPSPLKSKVAVAEGKPQTLSDIIPSPAHARSLSMNGSFNLSDLQLEDDSILRSIHRHLVNGTSVLDGLPASHTTLDSGADSKEHSTEQQQQDGGGGPAADRKRIAAETLAEKRRSIYKANSRPTSGISFEGFTSFDEVRRGFEFHNERPGWYPPPVPKNAAVTTNNVGNHRRGGAHHRKHESTFSIASVSSYGHVISAGSIDPFDYAELDALSEENMTMEVSSASFSMEVEDTFANRACGPLRLRKRVDSDASSFYFRSGPAPRGGGHRRRESNMSVTSVAPPISLYNNSRAFTGHGHRRTDSNASGIAGWAARHRRDMSTDSMMSDFSSMMGNMQQLGRPGVGDKMFGERRGMGMDSADNTMEHGALSAISASPPESSGAHRTFEHDEVTGYDSIMDADGSDVRYSNEYSDSIIERTGYDRYRDSMASDMVFEADYAQRFDQGKLQAPIRFQLPNVGDRTSVHSPIKEDDTMISMLGGGHVRRRSMEMSPSTGVEKRKRAAIAFGKHQVIEESPKKARIMEKPSIASTASFQFGGDRMIKAQRGLLERQSLEESCLIADGEELAAAYLNRSGPVFTRPSQSARSRSSTCTSSSSGGDTPPLSLSDGASISEGSQSSIDMAQLNIALTSATSPVPTVATARARALAHGTGHRRRYSKSHVSRSSVYETIEEEMMSSHHGSPANSILKDSPTTRQAVYIVDSDTASINSRPDESVWDDERGIVALRRYYALRDEAKDTVTESKRTWSDTPFSLYAIQSFRAPSEPERMQALLAHSVQNFGPLPSELRPHRVRSRTSSRASPYPQSRVSKTNLSPEQSPHTITSKPSVTAQRTPVLQAKSLNTQTTAAAPTLDALKPFSPLSFLDTEPKRENAFGLAPNARPRVGSNARRTALGWSKRSNGPTTGKSSTASTDQKENIGGNGLSMTPAETLRLNRPRPRGRPTPGGRTPATQARAVRI